MSLEDLQKKSKNKPIRGSRAFHHHRRRRHRRTKKEPSNNQLHRHSNRALDLDDVMKFPRPKKSNECALFKRISTKNLSVSASPVPEGILQQEDCKEQVKLPYQKEVEMPKQMKSPLCPVDAPNQRDGRLPPASPSREQLINPSANLRRFNVSPPIAIRPRYSAPDARLYCVGGPTKRGIPMRYNSFLSTFKNNVESVTKNELIEQAKKYGCPGFVSRFSQGLKKLEAKSDVSCVVHCCH